MTRVLYVSGSGRSGSTLLERLLHSAETVASVGEFHCLWRMPLDKSVCACGMSVADDPFWREVLDHAEVDAEVLARMGELERQVARTGALVRYRLSAKRLGRSAEAREYLATQRRIYEAIADSCGASLIVDTSKAGPRAWLLATEPESAVCHLYRDPRDVIRSWRSKKFDKGLGGDMQRPSIWSAAVDWLKVEVLVRLLRRQVAVHSLTYERLVTAPSQVVDTLLSSLDLVEQPAVAWTGTQRFLAGGNYHSVNGNPDRFETGEIVVGFRRVSGDRLSLLDRVGCWAIGTTLRMTLRPRSAP